VEGVDAPAVEDLGEQVMSDMMNEFEKLGEKEDYSGVIDKLMQQLLSKEVRCYVRPFPGFNSSSRQSLCTSL
jgi:hypothetical protein